jgi:hypothetical protein
MKSALFFFCTLVGVFSHTLRAELLEREYISRHAAPTERVSLHVVRGMVEIYNGQPGSEVVIETRMRVQGPGTGGATARSDEAVRPPSPNAAERVFQRMQPRIKSDARHLRMSVADSRGVVFDWDSTLQMVIEVKVTLPPGLNLQVRNVAAGVTFPDGFQGNVDVRSDGGSIFAGNIQGDFIARTGTGSITVSEVTGRSELRSDTGLLLAGRLHGSAELRTLNGSIEVQHAHDRITMRGSDSDLVIGVSEPLPTSLDLRTSAGRIWVNIDRDVGLSVDAVSRLLGNVRVRGLALAPDEGGRLHASLVGDLNGGGPLLRARTRGGEILLIGRDPISSDKARGTEF